MQILKFIQQSQGASVKLLNTIPFIFENKLWQGFFKQKLVLLVTVLAAIVIPLSMFNFMSDLFEKMNNRNTSLGLASLNLSDNLNFSTVFSGTNQYILLLIIHMLNIYFSNKTIERLSGVTIDLSVKEMINSVFRNLKVLIRTWLAEVVLGVVIGIIIGIFGPDWLEDVLKYIAGCYFLGYIFIDNYNATFAVSIKESFQIVKKHAGAAVVFGLVGKILLLLPYIGVFIMSFICGVAATWYMHTSEDRHAGELAFTDEI